MSDPLAPVGTIHVDRSAASTDTGAAPALIRVALVCGDHAFRESLSLTLARYGMMVVPFASAAQALKHLAAVGGCHIVLVDLDAADGSGLLFLQELRRIGIQLPVIVLSGQAEASRESYEKAALDGGADDFIDRSRSVAILAMRVALAVRRAGGLFHATLVKASRKGRAVELHLNNGRVQWQGVPIPLSATEARIVRLLAINAGEGVSYRAIYNLVHGPNFVAGRGPEGYRPNVRTTMKRIRRKFLAIDEDFNEIDSLAAYGYRWRGAKAPTFDWQRYAPVPAHVISRRPALEGQAGHQAYHQLARPFTATAPQPVP